MTRKKTGIILLVTGLLIAFLAVFFIVRAVMGFMEEMKPLVEVESGKTITIHLNEPGPYTLWADNALHTSPSTGSTTVTTTYSLTEQATGKQASYKPMGMTATRNYGSTFSEGLGVFDAPTAGQYEFAATDPSGKIPQFSLTAGEFGFGFIKNPLVMVLALLAGGFSLVMIIVGCVLMALKPKTASAPPLPPAQP